MSRTAIPNEESVAPARRPHLGTLSSSALRHAGDDRLVSLTRAGSERAFAEIMRRYERPLYLFCLQYLGAGRAEDAAQQTFMQAFVALRDGARREIALRPWLYRIARNCSIDLLRKQGSDHDELDPEFDGMSRADGQLEQKEELARIVRAILALPEGQRRALTLRELEGRSYGEISAELGHTDSGVRQLIFRARTTLRNLGAVLFPVGTLRWRFLGQASPGIGDPHQVAAAASVPAPGGTGALDALGAIVAATVTLAAGGGTVGHHHRAAAQGADAAIPATAAPFVKPSIGPPATLGVTAAPAKHVRVRTRRAASLTAPVGPPATTPMLVPGPAAPAVPSPIAPAPSAVDPALPAQAATPASAPADAGTGAATTLAQKPGTVSANVLTRGKAPAGPLPAGTTGSQGPSSTTPGGQKTPSGSGSGSTPATGKPVAAPKAPKVAAPKQPAAPKLPAQPKASKPAKAAPAQPTKASATT
jgi:RNA polymerase sigma factor (sigma-70 family)